MKPGYKQTEIGVIPEDWSITSVEEIGHITSGESPTLLKEGPIPYFKVEQLNNSLKYQVTSPYHVSTNRAIAAGSIIFPKRGAAIATNKIRILAKESYIDTNIMALTVRTNTIFAEYLYYWLIRKGLWDIADTTSVPQINNKHIYPLQFPTPALPEQKRIAEALSDVDELISSLEKLIAKKKAVKQGAMEQLLTGKTRLPGFSGEWRVCSVDDIAEFCTATVPTESITIHHYIGTDNMISNKGGVYNNEIAIAYTTVREYRVNDILLSNIRPYLKKIWLADRSGGCSNDVLVIRAKDTEKITPSFLYYLLSQDCFFEEVMANAIGTKMPRGDKAVIMAYHIQIPQEVKEQHTIVDMLNEIDNDIDYLDKKLAKIRCIKQGMMQQLLTGKIRLV